MSLNPVVSLLGRRLRLAVIGGGPGSFIGAMHRQAAALDNRYELVAAALSSNPEKSLRAGRELGLPAERVYASGLALIEGEKGKENGADVIAIMTPNDSHFELASAALAAGFDVICDKPMTNTVDEAERLISGIVDPAHAAIEAQAPAGSPHAPSLRPHAKDAEPVLTFDHVEFAYPNGGAAVHDLNLTLYPGELVGIVGQNGAGKTTLTKLLTGLLKPASGSVRVTGLDTAAVPTSRIAREVATLFQNPDRQICKDTVLDEVAFGLELAGIDRAEALRRAQLVIDRFGLPADEAPFSLSRGQRQMVALASVVVVEPKIVVLDEPTSGLDYRECMTVMETVRTMAERGCAVIMVCHDMEVVSDFAERIVVMADGRILDRGRTHELFSNIDLMRRAYVEPPQVIELSRRLASSVSPAFAQVSEVTDVVRITKEMVHRG